jgi:hypothetical protein
MVGLISSNMLKSKIEFDHSIIGRSESYVFRLMTLLSKSISSTKFLSKHFVEKFQSTSISSTEHFVDRTFRRQFFCRQSTSPTEHFADTAFRRQITSSIESEGVGVRWGYGVGVWSEGVGVRADLRVCEGWTTNSHPHTHLKSSPTP